ncbi:hypothetical protein [Aquirufa ecclesiirivi]|nr:hypothetical protein [Aquirufa ecclesiirivi]MDF0694512.1 hypothetical protein [Aquirufa ecclesiirivi]
MKKILAIVLFATFVCGACSQNTNCPAYGTTRADAPKVKRG